MIEFGRNKVPPGSALVLMKVVVASVRHDGYAIVTKSNLGAWAMGTGGGYFPA